MIGSKWKSLGWGFIGAAAAFALYTVASTAWVDHQRLTAVWDLAVQNAQQARQAQAQASESQQKK